MTRKRFIKLLMAGRWNRNEASAFADKALEQQSSYVDYYDVLWLNLIADIEVK